MSQQTSQPMEEVLGLDEKQDYKFYVTFTSDESKWRENAVELQMHNIKPMGLLNTAFSRVLEDIKKGRPIVEEPNKMPENCFHMTECPRFVFELFIDITNKFNINGSNPKMPLIDDLSKMKYGDDKDNLGYVCLTEDPNKYFTTEGQKLFLEYIKPYYDIYEACKDKTTQSVAVLMDLLEYSSYLEIGPVFELLCAVYQFRLQRTSVKSNDANGQEIIIENKSADEPDKPLIFTDDVMDPTTEVELKLIAEFKERMPTYDGRCLKFLDPEYRTEFLKKVEGAYVAGTEERLKDYEEIKEDSDD